MKFVRYDGDRLGLLSADERGIIDLSERLGLSSADPLVEYIRGAYDAEAYADAPVDHAVDDVTLEAPVAFPRKIVAAPSNYREHIDEMSGTGVKPLSYFLKAPSSVVGPGDTIELPFSDRRCDHEIELAFVMGDDVKNVDRDDVWEHIFGYTILLDISVRGDQDRSNRKSYDTFTVVGPCVATPDEVGDPLGLDLQLRLNDEIRQDANTAQFVYTPDEIVEYASIGSTIHAGDVVTTGTPSGVGPLSEGDVLEATIENVGTMTNPVVEHDVSFEDVRVDKSG